MSTSFNISIDGRPACFASAKKGRLTVGFWLEREAIRLYAYHHYKGFPKAGKDGSGNFPEDRGTVLTLENYFKDEQTENLLDQSLELHHKVEIQLLNSDKPARKGEVAPRPKGYVNISGEKLVVRQNDHIQFQENLTAKSALHVFFREDDRNKYVLCVTIQVTDWEYSKKTFPLRVGDKIQISFDREFPEQVKMILPAHKAAG